MIVNMHQAKTHLSKLTEKFLDGEEIIVAKNGKPVFKFAPVKDVNNDEKPIGFFNCDVDMTHFDDPIEGMETYQ